MPRKSSKKPFIDKKKSVTFQLVHRSLKDPLAADDEAPQRVLVPIGGSPKIPDSVSEAGTYQYEEMISERKKYGIGFEDDYDYLQHLKASDNQPAILVPKSKDSVVEIEEGDDGMSEIIRDNKPILKLPSSVFGSTVEEPVGLLFRAIPPVGPQPSWDPDIVAGIDDDFDFENPENQLQDDFVVQASQPGDNDSLTSEDFMESDVESCESNKLSDLDDTKSQFTHYSLTSSVIRRNEQLTLLDDKFERFFESYQDSNMGDLSQVEIEGVFPVEDINEVEGMKTLLGLKVLKKKKKLRESDKPEWNKHYVYDPDGDGDGDGDIDEEMETLVKEEVDKKWDCETILSTYSNLYNHPKLIEEEGISKVKVSEKTGIPLSDHPKLTKQQLRAFDETNNPNISVSQVESHKSSHPSRKKNETKEEKKLRKQCIKELKKDRRLEKKATKLAFQEERSRQKKELMNIQQNLTGIRIS